MYRYAFIDVESGMVIGDSHLSGEVERPDLIPVSGDFDLTDKKYVNGEWVEYTPEPVEEKPTEQETINAEILLTQAEILGSQNAVEEALAAILLNQTGGQADV
ncbi:hypothetical protein BRYFOR_07636 [Marvinbryantia formatexigens DSM 14469]|uniref:Uncharacterized protein n=1 Tax=Marvinbryantia formatexigens DSM 14469 TaxID=478749 RepID=C6LG76_9FIRM|nr:hypothetical protein [Marvinbryantia formatexigens]EET60440.1 hypothetical protein BRYFOR_07636 [Marvinbryantia formatexigens DSM 14469]UWO25221.1 flagellar basal-body rod protein [Marvinbryantia formatexigens DSM 14469]SDH05507.1 hypothetical protein SAMN05660368_03767 [Marvinbryantia formatexigens]